MASDLISGFEAGQGVVDRYAGYEQQKVRTGQINRELDQRAQFEADKNTLLRKELELRESRQKDLRDQLTVEMDIQKKNLEWTTLKQKQHLEQKAMLVDMQKDSNTLLLSPAGPDFFQKSHDIANKYAGLTASDDPEIKGTATAMAKQWADKLNGTILAKKMLDQSRAWQNGFIPEGQEGDKAAIQNGMLAQDMEDVYTAGNAAGVNLHDPKYQSIMEGVQQSGAGGLSEQSKAKFGRVIEAEKAARAQAVPDKESKITVGVGEPNDKGGYPTTITASLGDIQANPVIFRLVAGSLAAQGKDPEAILGIKADENGVARITDPYGVIHRWSQSANRYVEYTPFVPPAQPAKTAPQRGYIGNNVNNLGNIIKGIFGAPPTP